MAVEMSDMDMLRQAVESTEPKSIFMKMWYSHEQSFRRRILSVLKVDVKKVQPIYIHKHIKYSRKFSNNMFLFLDKEYRIMAYLKGNTWNKDWLGAEDYDKPKKHWGGKRVDKKREILWQKSYHILMIEEKDIQDMTLSLSVPNRKINFIENERNMKIRLINNSKEQRLYEFKCKKYSYVGYDEILRMMNQVLIKSSFHIIEQSNSFDELMNSVLSRVYGYSYNVEGLIQYIAKEISQFKHKYSEYQLQVQRKYDTRYYEREYVEQKMKMIALYNRFFKNSCKTIDK
jgi:hypothetical protein